ncbi:MAG: transglycosylase SLT domain-containing protein [Chloroflexota bacterium]|nr:transglycosylase SLT domain-containing protein [Chloroflexota bacterium]
MGLSQWFRERLRARATRRLCIAIACALLCLAGLFLPLEGRTSPNAFASASDNTPTTVSTGSFNASRALVHLSQLDSAQYATPQEYQTWAYVACSAASMTEVLNAYGHRYRITDILNVEARLGEITPQLGLVEDVGIARTVATFGFNTTWGHQLSLDDVIATANTGKPVIVNWPPDRWAGGHLLVVTGGDVTSVFLADSSSYNITLLPRDRFSQLWGGFSAIVTPHGDPSGSTGAGAASKYTYIGIAHQDALDAGIPPTYFIRQINMESGFDPAKKSSTGQEGIAQFTPALAHQLGVDPWNPIASLHAAAQLMTRYSKTYRGDYAKALAAYYASPDQLDHAVSACGEKWRDCLPTDTRSYIVAIVGV